MTRIVKKQRYQIGTLKSLGVKKNKIIMHYVSYGFFISLIASILGVVLGPLLIGNLFIGIKMNYFQIPNGRAAFATISYLIAVLGAVIIYNLGILSFTEKQYQFATLKVLGFKNKKIRRIYVKQNNWITIASIIIGLPLGFYMTNFIFTMAISDSYDMVAFINLFLTYMLHQEL